MTAFVAGFGLLVTIAAFALYGRATALSTGVGAIVALANFLILRFIVVRVVEGDVHRKLPFIGALFLKMGALMGFVYYVIANRWVEAISFTAGLSSLVVGLLAASFLAALRTDTATTGTEDAAR
jgi:hypothetical protein